MPRTCWQPSTSCWSKRPEPDPVNGPVPPGIPETVEVAQPLRRDSEPDATDRALTLAASEARHRDLAEVASDWLWETNADHRFTFISKRFAETSGIPWASIAGRAT